MRQAEQQLRCKRNCQANCWVSLNQILPAMTNSGNKRPTLVTNISTSHQFLKYSIVISANRFTSSVSKLKSEASIFQPFKIKNMKAIKVEYTVKPEYVSTNKANIQKVMDELRALGD